MTTNDTTLQSLGGQKRAILQRADAEQKYYQNPKHCKQCGNIIPVIPTLRIADIRIKKFCNVDCRKLFYKSKPKIKICTICQKQFEVPIEHRRSRVKRCGTCRENQIAYADKLSYLTKNEIFKTRKNWQSARTDIRRHANRVFDLSNKTKECAICKYKLHVEICHIKSVSSFSKETKLSEINDISNLITLCPNHHWELDNGYLKMVAARGI